jgi:hypothetical protein
METQTAANHTIPALFIAASVWINVPTDASVREGAPMIHPTASDPEAHEGSEQVRRAREAAAMRARFRNLAAEWRRDMENVSSFTKMFSHPAYREIGNMGTDVLPFIFAEMRDEPDWWFAALKKIVGFDPVPKASHGNLREMTRYWLTYADGLDPQHAQLPGAGRRLETDQREGR